MDQADPHSCHNGADGRGFTPTRPPRPASAPVGTSGRSANIPDALVCCSLRCAPVPSRPVPPSRHCYRSHVRARLGRGGEATEKAGHPRGFPRTRKTPPERFPRVTPPATGRGASLLSCGDVEANPGPPPKDWGGPGLGGGGMWPPGHFPGLGCLCNGNEPPVPGLLADMFAQSWDYATAGSLWANPKWRT